MILTQNNIKEAEHTLRQFLDFLEARYYVTVHAKGDNNGVSKLVLADKETGEEHEFERERIE
jgi:hypothetical protein